MRVFVVSTPDPTTGNTTRGDISMPTPKKSAAKKTSSKSTPQISDNERMRMVSEAAYYMAEHRGFTPGDELSDWLAAEQQINTQVRH